MAEDCSKEDNIKYVLIFKNYNLNKDTIINKHKTKYISINKGIISIKSFAKMDAQYAIFKKDENTYEIREEFAPNLNIHEILLTGYLEGENVKYMFNSCKLPSDVKILKYNDKDIVELDISKDDENHYHVYLNRITNKNYRDYVNFGEITNINDNKYFLIKTNKDNENITEILCKKIKQDNFKKKNVFVYYINYEIVGDDSDKISMKIEKCQFNEIGKLENFSDDIDKKLTTGIVQKSSKELRELQIAARAKEEDEEDDEEGTSATVASSAPSATSAPVAAPAAERKLRRTPAAQSGGKLKMVVDSRGIATDLFPVLKSIFDPDKIPFETLYANTSDRKDKYRKEHTISNKNTDYKCIKKDDTTEYESKQESIKNEVEEFKKSNHGKLPFVLYIDDSPEIPNNKYWKEDEYTIYWHAYSNVLGIDKLPQQNTFNTRKKIESVLEKVDNNINIIVIKLKYNSTGILGNNDVLENLPKLVQKIKDSNRDLLFITDFDCTITTVHLWGINKYKNQYEENKYVKEEQIKRYNIIENNDTERINFFFETDTVPSNGQKNKDNLKDLFQKIYDIYNKSS